jgi:hypothetical protein
MVGDDVEFTIAPDERLRASEVFGNPRADDLALVVEVRDGQRHADFSVCRSGDEGQSIALLRFRLSDAAQSKQRERARR